MGVSSSAGAAVPTAVYTCSSPQHCPKSDFGFPPCCAYLIVDILPPHVQLLRVWSNSGYPCIERELSGLVSSLFYVLNSRLRPTAFCVCASLGVRPALPFLLIRCIPAGHAVFGNSETFKRVPLPAVLENLSRVLKASLVLFWGRWGLPIPFKVRLVDAYNASLRCRVSSNSEHVSQKKR